MADENTASDREDQAGQKSTRGAEISNSPGTGELERNRRGKDRHEYFIRKSISQPKTRPLSPKKV